MPRREATSPLDMRRENSRLPAGLGEEEAGEALLHRTQVDILDKAFRFFQALTQLLHDLERYGGVGTHELFEAPALDHAEFGLFGGGGIVRRG